MPSSTETLAHPNHDKLEGLKRLVAAFPEDKRLSFFDCHDRKLSFPFLAFADDHHQSLPDIAVSFPGQVIDQNMKKPHWSMFSMVIEAKATAAQDPFQKTVWTAAQRSFSSQ